MAAHQTDHAVMEDSLVTLGDRYDGMAAELFNRFIAGHPHYAPVFLNPEAARERMTRETLEAMLGLAASEWWVDHAVTNFIDLHHNYADFTPHDYAAWFALVIETMATRAGADWPDGASAAWQRQADGLVAKVATVDRNSEVPVRT
ncbi:globin [Sphingorhabdus sp. M41]|uniref:globin n=1 Tax=Sphingorhabdus sp. M41 TaxID=1806885 RepID=UPI00078E23AC|nr:globin [Sphingorhabdus sp. M41]AMO72050.1 hypothetical protein AZE99_09495 [Sphingorhabdus sp. M41]